MSFDNEYGIQLNQNVPTKIKFVTGIQNLIYEIEK